MLSIDPGGAIMAATVTLQLAAGFLTATRLHERDRERRPFRTVVIVLGVFATLLAIGQYVLAQNSKEVLEAKADDAESSAHAAAHHVGIFAFRRGAAQHIADAARALRAPEGAVPVHAIADHDTSMVCAAIADALRLAGWTVNDACATTAFFQDLKMSRSRSPVVIAFDQNQSSRAIALATTLSREGVLSQALELDSADVNAGAYPLAILLRYL